jgi:hypothetical protein
MWQVLFLPVFPVFPVVKRTLGFFFKPIGRDKLSIGAARVCESRQS